MKRVQKGWNRVLAAVPASNQFLLMISRAFSRAQSLVSAPGGQPCPPHTGKWVIGFSPPSVSVSRVRGVVPLTDTHLREDVECATRASSGIRRMGLLAAIALLALATGESARAAMPTESPVAAQPTLQWITLAPIDPSRDRWGCSLQFSCEESSSWLLEVRPVDTVGRSGERSIHRQHIRNRELTYFPIFMSRGDTLSIRVTDCRLGSAYQLLVSLPHDEASKSAQRYVIPEWSPLRGSPDPARGWIPMNVTLEEGSVVRLSILDGRGAVVQAWSPGFLDAGHTAILWDGRDPGGRLMPAGKYFFRTKALEAGSPVALPGSQPTGGDGVTGCKESRGL